MKAVLIQKWHMKADRLMLGCTPYQVQSWQKHIHREPQKEEGDSMCHNYQKISLMMLFHQGISIWNHYQYFCTFKKNELKLLPNTQGIVGKNIISIYSIISTVSADVLAPYGAKTSTDTVTRKLGYGWIITSYRNLWGVISVQNSVKKVVSPPALNLKS